MARVGLDARTGRLLYGWAHCVQSITEILMTELGERVQRRGFGAALTSMIDRPQNEETVVDIYMATAQALEPREIEGRQYGEPGFILLRSSLDASTPGKLILMLSGIFFENGHIGDYSNPSAREVTYAVERNEDGLNLEVI